MTVEVNSVDTVAQASAALTDSSRYFAGGTLLMRQVNYADQSISRMIISDDPALKVIQSQGSEQGSEVHIGAGVTMSSIMQHPDLQFLAEVARSVGGPAIRNMATIGGNLFAPRPYGDMACALLALDATLHWSDGQQQSIDAFLEQTDNTGGIVTAVSLQRPASGSFRYMKVSRVKPKGVALISVAALLGRESGRVGGARIAFGGMAAKPRRATAAENALQGASLDETGIANCLAVCTEGMAPEDDALASAWYRNQVAPVYLRRLLLQRSEY